VLLAGFAVWLAHAQVPANPAGQTPQPSQKHVEYDSNAVMPQTASFLKDVSRGNHAEMQLARIAESNALRSEVKSLARRIEQDHHRCQEDLQDLAEAKNVDVPDDPTADQQATAKRLDDLKGSAFDQAYLTQMVTEHQKDIDAFRTHQNIDDPEVAVFVKSTLPVLQYHLDRVQDLQRQIYGR
jgi:putative membrane protein